MSPSSDVARGARTLALVKLGGSLITEKGRPDTARAEVIARLAAEIVGSLPRLHEDGLLLGHGSGSFGHPAAAAHGLGRGLRDPEQLRGVTETQARAAALHRMVVRALIDAGLPVFSVAPSASAVTEDGRPVAFAAEPVARALDRGLVPVVYGDVVMDRSRGAAILSTEMALAALAGALGRHGWRAGRALWLGATPGVLGHEGQPIAEISPTETRAAEEAAGPSDATDVTGGMAHRLAVALELARDGVPSWIGDGREAGALARALLAPGVEELPGTRVLPAVAGGDPAGGRPPAAGGSPTAARSSR